MLLDVPHPDRKRIVLEFNLRSLVPRTTHKPICVKACFVFIDINNDVGKAGQLSVYLILNKL